MGCFKKVLDGINNIREIYYKDKNINTAWLNLLDLADSKDSDIKKAMRGIGTVYLLTLLYFITGGATPIYDRFAMAALLVWKLRDSITIPENSIIRVEALPDKKDDKVRNILKEGLYSKYIELLSDFCGMVYGDKDKWKDDRNVDRALWVYGHFFEVNG